ncbi:hypothetical protein TrST_g5910 [Triparma strigata]|uniref:Ferrochelatase n=1 Tax=Triparma strigata TaxID=1606541 RepID=A0A9W7EDH2_9STRA|nr:hypothetical protein TrST_g5910 [Triparma strigata]
MLVATLLVTLNIADGYVPMASQSFRTERAGRSAFLRPSSSSLSSTWLQAATMPEGATSGATTDSKIGVLFLNLGGPEKSTDVEGFLYNLFADPDIIRLPPFISGLQKPIALAISKRRAPKSREAYNSIGGGSPIVKYTTEQANLISQALASNHNLAVKTYIGMRYWFPFTEQALAEIAEDGIQSLVILPLYPQFSVSTSGSSLRLLQEEFSKEESVVPKSMKHTVVASWYDRPGYVSSVAGLIMQELESFTEEELEKFGPEKHVLFSAHGVPQSYIDNGDPYQAQIQDCVERIGKSLPEDVTVHLSYQSRVGPIEWLRPYTDDVLPELGEQGVKNLVVVPISFVSEHIETLEEIDIEYRELAEESGIENWRRCPALNTDQTFINDMADLVVESLESPTLTVTEACVNNNCIDVKEISQLIDVDKEAKVAERMNGRFAMLGIVSTLLVELASGKSLLHMFGL